MNLLTSFLGTTHYPGLTDAMKRDLRALIGALAALLYLSSLVALMAWGWLVSSWPEWDGGWK